MSIKEVPFGIVFVAVLMILFGLAEVVTGFRHHFSGISTSQSAILLGWQQPSALSTSQVVYSS